MFNVNKDFYIAKSYQLARFYNQSHQYSKEKFILELIKYQYFFGSKSIFGCELLVNNRYNYKTVKSVLTDLGYSLVSFKVVCSLRFYFFHKYFSLVTIDLK